ncbi:hypothetical protein C9I49_11220 [Pseudomonas prosekii]|uniref:Uncharacterized protein n=1 Tax=Pseudomonas prosekii TaxID=1148509 RepID=A0A2U2D8W9_9PSED|nr:hypothetical protein C9I49_11220 [Pseudomonas prosekii]
MQKSHAIGEELVEDGGLRSGVAREGGGLAAVFRLSERFREQAQLLQGIGGGSAMGRAVKVFFRLRKHAEASRSIFVKERGFFSF